MSEDAETQSPHVAYLLTGRQIERGAYATWRGRGTTDWLLTLTLDGMARFGFDGGECLSSPGDLVLIRPGTRHDYSVEPSLRFWDCLWTHFRPRPHWHDALLLWPEISPGLMRLTLSEPIIRARLTARFWDAHKLATGTLRHRELFAMNALEEILLWCETQISRPGTRILDERVRGTMDYLCQNLDAKITLDGLAARAGMSPSRLASLFRAQLGATPQQFLEAQRLNRARQLLEMTARPIAAIAEEVGFENPFYFTLRFKRQTGLSPRDWRKRGDAE